LAIHGYAPEEQRASLKGNPLSRGLSLD